jgi:hypothetical protein
LSSPRRTDLEVANAFGTRRWLKRSTENERDRLGDGFDDEEIASSPPCGRAANTIRRLQFQLTVNDEVAWSNFLTGIDAESE